MKEFTIVSDSQLKIGWTERYQKHWYLTLNKWGKNAPMRLRSDFRTAVTIMNRLHRESGEERPKPIPFQQG